MGSFFRQLTSEDRVAICQLLRAGISKDKIAKQLGFHRSTIYREIKRNSGVNLGYVPIIAERKIKLRRKRVFKLNQDIELRNYIFDKLRRSWSPEQIAGRLKLKNNGQSLICHETIYAYIYSSYGIRNKYYYYLRKRRRFRYPKISRKRKSAIPNRVPISKRPAEIKNRHSMGHWECDLMQFKRNIKTNIITIRERFSRYIIAIKNRDRSARRTANNIIKKLVRFGKQYVKSLTFDNGFEFAYHEKIGRVLKADTYFCEPYKSYQKGTVENGNKMLREWLPRDISIDTIPTWRLNQLAELLNRRPMKLLGYRTPKEVFYGVS